MEPINRQRLLEASKAGGEDESMQSSSANLSSSHQNRFKYNSQQPCHCSCFHSPPPAGRQLLVVWNGLADSTCCCSFSNTSTTHRVHKTSIICWGSALSITRWICAYMERAGMPNCYCNRHSLVVNTLRARVNLTCSRRGETKCIQ